MGKKIRNAVRENRKMKEALAVKKDKKKKLKPQKLQRQAPESDDEESQEASASSAEAGAPTPAAAPAKQADGGAKKEKQAKKEDPVAAAAKEKLAKEALKEILEGIKKGDKQTKCAFCPRTWHTKYRPTLGAYRRFCQAQTETLQVIERKNGGYIIIGAGEMPPKETAFQAPAKNWANQLMGAWSTYCQVTPAGERSVETFFAALPASVRDAKPGKAGAASPAGGPKSDPAASATSEGTRPVKKKLKKKAVA